MSYAEKLKDPRWQRKRLEIMERDGFKCVRCGSDVKTLHVHHLAYAGNPWEVRDSALATLCEDCHTVFHGQMEIIQAHLVRRLELSGFLVRALEDEGGPELLADAAAIYDRIYVAAFALCKITEPNR